MKQENSIYLVGYCYGRYEFTTIISFVTSDEEKAKAYCEKFNRVIAKYHQHMSDFPHSGIYINHFYEDIKPWYKKTKLK